MPPLLDVPSPFPVAHRLIYKWPVLHWPRKGEDPNSIGPQFAGAVAQILELHPDQRGLLHTVAYQRGATLRQFCASPRLVFHSPKDFDEQFALFSATPGSVFCSPRALEGLDLRGDACEFVVFIKIPFPFLGDPRVRRRHDVDSLWYNLQAVTALVQGSGRAVRCVSDIAPTYILDAAWPWFYMANWKLFPPYWRDARRNFQPEQIRISPP